MSTTNLTPLDYLKRIELRTGKGEGSGHRRTLWLLGDLKDIEQAARIFGRLGYRKDNERRQDFSAIRYDQGSRLARIRVYNVHGLIDFLSEHFIIPPADVKIPMMAQPQPSMVDAV